MKIGITQRGDAGIDFSWQEKLSKLDAGIIISKCANDKLIEALIRNQNKIIYHATCTGLGNSILQPNVPKYQDKLIHIQNLIKHGFETRRIVLRIDPIINPSLYQQLFNKPYRQVIEDILKFALTHDIKRIRYSYIDMYNHVIERFKNAEIKKLSNINMKEINEFEELFDKYENYGLIINSCGEKYTKEHRKVGCISKEDFKIFGLNEEECKSNSFKQRLTCLCCSAKTQMLNNKHPCQNKCLYCYWKD